MHRPVWPLSWLCEVLDVSRSGFHAWRNRPTSRREIHDARLVTAIEIRFKPSDRTSGAWRDVGEEGLACGPPDQCLTVMPQAPWKARGR